MFLDWPLTLNTHPVWCHMLVVVSSSTPRESLLSDAVCFFCVNDNKATTVYLVNFAYNSITQCA